VEELAWCFPEVNVESLLEGTIWVHERASYSPLNIPCRQGEERHVRRRNSEMTPCNLQDVRICLLVGYKGGYLESPFGVRT
jgi:hypothetical protein